MRKFFQSDFFLLLLSLGMAVLVWYAIRQTTRHEETLHDVPVEIRQNEGWAVEDVSSDAIQITFQGSREDITRLKPEGIRVELDLRNQERDQVVVKLTPRHIIYPGALRVVSIRPDTLRVRMDPEIVMTVPVKAAYTGTAAPGYVRDREEVQPATVAVRGSRRQLESVSSLQTAPIDLTGRTASFETRATVPPPPGSWIQRIDPGRVRVLTTISHRVVDRLFESLPVALPATAALPGGVRVSPSTVSVRVEADEGQSEVLNTAVVEVSVDLPAGQRVTPGPHPLRVRAPDGLRIVEIAPQKVMLEGLPESPKHDSESVP